MCEFLKLVVKNHRKSKLIIYFEPHVEPPCKKLKALSWIVSWLKVEQRTLLLNAFNTLLFHIHWLSNCFILEG